MAQSPNQLKNLRPYQPGQSGNPLGINAGRPPRARLTEAFIGDFSNSWAKHGPRVLDELAVKQPSQYAALAAKLVPAEVAVSLEARSSVLDDADLAILRAIKAEVVGANDMTPEQVFEHARAALRAYNAQVIEAEIEDPMIDRHKIEDK
jgi:hypothetical protein